MTIDAATLDRIDVRYAVKTHFEFGGRDFFVAKASFQITASLHAGIPTKDDMADLIVSRGLHEGDIDDLSGTDLSEKVVIAMIMEKSIVAGDITEMVIDEVTVDDVAVAQSFL